MRILFISTWFPYPPNQGSKIRAYYLLKGLAQDHDVALLSFEDGHIKTEWRDHIGRICQIVKTVPRDPFQTDTKETWLGWFSSRPSAVRSIFSQEMAEVVQKTAQEWHPDCVVALTFVAAPYALQVGGVPKVLDVDNLMTRMLHDSYRMEPSNIGKARRWLAYKKFERYEIWLCGQFDRCLVVTADDQQILMRMLGSNMEHIRVTPNGVDTSIYRPDEAYPVPNTLVYNGALTYIANYDAMNFFIGDILPQVVSQVPGVRLKITGKTEGVEVDHLLTNGNVELTGYLDDIRPTVAESWACVVPLRMGGGTRLKILEAMALGTPVISTTKGAEGLDVVPGEHILVADEPQDFASATLQLLGDPGMRAKLARNAAKYVKERYDWYPIGQEFRVTVEELVK